MTTFLKLKHWQLFGLLIGIPLVFQSVTIGSMMSSNGFTDSFLLFPIMMILFVTLFFSWFYAIGTNLHKKLPPTVNMKLGRFKLFLFIPVAYMLLISIYMVSIYSRDLTAGVQPGLGIAALIVPLHLFSMFCIFYCLHFVAKELKAVEWQRPVTFSDFAGEFFLIWFFPLGVWNIQPRINKLFNTSSENSETINTN